MPVTDAATSSTGGEPTTATRTSGTSGDTISSTGGGGETGSATSTSAASSETGEGSTTLVCTFFQEQACAAVEVFGDYEDCGTVDPWDDLTPACRRRPATAR